MRLDYYKKPPYQWVGSKWQWSSIFEDSADMFARYDTIIDAYGGSCWVTHWLEHHTEGVRLICNDFDEYLPAITMQENIDLLNSTFDHILSIYENCPFTDEELANTFEGRLFPRIGKGRDGWHYREKVTEIKEIIAKLPTNALRSLIWSRFWLGGAPSPNVLWYPTPYRCKPFERVENYITRAEIIRQDAMTINIEPDMGRVLMICDPPFSAVQCADHYYIGKMDSDCHKGSPAAAIHDRFVQQCDLVIFSDMEQLAELPSPSEIWIREVTSKPFGSAKYHHPVTQRVQGAYIYRRN